MQKVLTAAQMRTVDRLTTERYGIPSIILMENAAHAVARVITEKLGGSVKGKSILILCGKGNNGGDGAALARILHMSGANVVVDLFGKVGETRGDAKTNFQILSGLARATARNFFREQELDDVDAFDDWLHASNFDFADVVVDALFGTGLNRELTGFHAELTGLMGNWRRSREKIYDKPYFISIDIPSGLSADSGQPLGANIHAHTTVTFTAPKSGNIVPPASGFNGELIIADIGSPQKLIDEQSSQLYLSEKEDASEWLDRTAFESDDYKNKRGHALVIAGSEDYSGAAVLAANAAMRSGVGLVTVATPSSSKDSVASRILPEVMVRGVAETDSGTISETAFDKIGDLLEKSDSIAIGCGLSQDESTKKFVEKIVTNADKPVVVDADALNLISPFPANWPPADAGDSDLILTPHEGEFMRLLGTDDKDAITDRVASVRDFATTRNVILVLKGERVLIAAPDGRVIVNPTGNSGLGKAGNGDTLTGILAGFTAQAAKMNIDIFETVVAVVYIAGMAGDVAEKKYGKRVMTASDVRECLSDVFRELCGN